MDGGSAAEVLFNSSSQYSRGLSPGNTFWLGVYLIIVTIARCT